MSETAKQLRAAYVQWNSPPSPELPQGAEVCLKAADELDRLAAELEAVRETGKALVRNAIAMGEATGDEWDRLCDERVELLDRLNGTAPSAGVPQSEPRCPVHSEPGQSHTRATCTCGASAIPWDSISYTSKMVGK